MLAPSARCESRTRNTIHTRWRRRKQHTNTTQLNVSQCDYYFSISFTRQIVLKFRRLSIASWSLNGVANLDCDDIASGPVCLAIECHAVQCTFIPHLNIPISSQMCIYLVTKYITLASQSSGSIFHPVIVRFAFFPISHVYFMCTTKSYQEGLRVSNIYMKTNVLKCRTVEHTAKGLYTLLCMEKGTNVISERASHEVNWLYISLRYNYDYLPHVALV